MGWEIFLKNSHTAEWILNLSLQLLIVSISGWIILKIWKPKSAPTRGGCYLAILVSLAIVPLFSVVFHTYKIPWFQTSIVLALNQYTSSATKTSTDYDASENSAVKSPKTTQLEKENQKSQDKSVVNRKFNLFQRDRVFMAINVFGIVWLIGILILLSRVVYGLVFLIGYKSGLVELKEKRIYQALNSVKRIFGEKPSPKIYVSPTLSSPITVGVRRPIVIIPRNLSKNMTEDELKCVLFHELAHIYHNDHLIGLMQRILTSLYWWNPFVYSISAGFSFSREEVSDNYAIEGLKNPRHYAENLLNLAEKTHLASWLPATAGMAGPHFTLEDRVKNIIKKGRNIGTKLNPKYVFVLVMGSRGQHFIA
jgi:beta-lactamase regulating signal transducer with metallopeptidase domain